MVVILVDSPFRRVFGNRVFRAKRCVRLARREPYFAIMLKRLHRLLASTGSIISTTVVTVESHLARGGWDGVTNAAAALASAARLAVQAVKLAKSMSTRLFLESGAACTTPADTHAEEIEEDYLKIAEAADEILGAYHALAAEDNNAELVYHTRLAAEALRQQLSLFIAVTAKWFDVFTEPKLELADGTRVPIIDIIKGAVEIPEPVSEERLREGMEAVFRVEEHGEEEEEEEEEA